MHVYSFTVTCCDCNKLMDTYLVYSVCTLEATLSRPLLSLQSGKMASPRTRRVLKEVRTEDENNVSTETEFPAENVLVKVVGFAFRTSGVQTTLST